MPSRSARPCTSTYARADTSFRAELLQAQVASAAHRFAEARNYLAQALRSGAPDEEIAHQQLAIDQASGRDLDDVLAARSRIAAASGRLEDLVPLGALLADLESFQEADKVYRAALYAYQGTSPFPPAMA